MLRANPIPIVGAGRRVNLLLALPPSALQIDPPPGPGAGRVGFAR